MMYTPVAILFDDGRKVRIICVHLHYMKKDVYRMVCHARKKKVFHWGIRETLTDMGVL
jgi:hypothetical protein